MPLDARVEIGIMIEANVGEVWRALVAQEKLDLWMIGSELELNWTIDEPDLFGRHSIEKHTKDSIRILKMEPLKRLDYICIDGFVVTADAFENLSAITIKLEFKRFGTYLHVVHLRQTTGGGLKMVQYRWSTMLIALKKLVEKEVAIRISRESLAQPLQAGS